MSSKKKVYGWKIRKYEIWVRCRECGYRYLNLDRALNHECWMIQIRREARKLKGN